MFFFRTIYLLALATTVGALLSLVSTPKLQAKTHKHGGEHDHSHAHSQADKKEVKTKTVKKMGKADKHADHSGHAHSSHAGHNHKKPSSIKEVLAFDYQNHKAIWEIQLPAVKGQVVTVSAFEATGEDRIKASAKPTDLILVLRPEKSGSLWKLKRLDATMPGHGHGMNTLPVLKRVSSSRYHAKNFALHMPGDWSFVLTALGKTKKKHKVSARYAAKP